MKKILTLICSASALILFGCYTPLLVDAPSKISDEHKFVKSYVLGEKKTVTVGDPMVKVQDYWIENFSSDFAYPDKSVTVKGKPVNIALEANKRYRVKGAIDVNGLRCLLLMFDQAENLTVYALVDPNGSLVNRTAFSLASGGRENITLMPSEAIISDPSVRIVRESAPVVKTTKGYENYELLYTGVSATGINLTYREFSPDGLARVAFFQNLTYEATAKSIAFKKFRIAVEAATSESITFTVLSDGQRESP
jgi:hypothetical protein